MIAHLLPVAVIAILVVAPFVVWCVLAGRWP